VNMSPAASIPMMMRFRFILPKRRPLPPQG
jgi:hypothetical protein